MAKKQKTIKNETKVDENEILSFPFKQAVINFGDQVLEMFIDTEELTGLFILTIGEYSYSLWGMFTETINPDN